MNEGPIIGSSEYYASSYSEYYQRNNEDSPPACRASMRNLMLSSLQTLPQGSQVLSLGSGAQIFEFELLQNKRILPLEFVTVDVANIAKENLLASQRHLQQVTHVRTSADGLPFSDGRFSLAYSILAFDFMEPRETVVRELYRVLAQNAFVFLALHHKETIIPDSLDEDIQNQAKRARRHNYTRGRMTMDSLLHKQYLREHNILFTSEEEIRKFFDEHGFHIDSCQLRSGRTSEKWWEVIMKKE